MSILNRRPGLWEAEQAAAIYLQQVVETTELLAEPSLEVERRLAILSSAAMAIIADIQGARDWNKIPTTYLCHHIDYVVESAQEPTARELLDTSEAMKRELQALCSLSGVRSATLDRTFRIFNSKGETLTCQRLYFLAFCYQHLAKTNQPSLEAAGRKYFVLPISPYKESY